MDKIKVDAASAKDWEILEKHAPDATFVSARCVLELRDRVAALEAAAKSAAAPVPASTPAPAGVTAEELVDCLPKRWNGSFEAFARHLLDHPRIGPLLRGEGAPAQKRVVLAKEPPALPEPGPIVWPGYLDGWLAARAEVARQQGGQADG